MPRHRLRLKIEHRQNLTARNTQGHYAQEELTMKNFRDEVNAVMAALSDAMLDAEKFDQGNESAGRRARVALSKNQPPTCATSAVLVPAGITALLSVR